MITHVEKPKISERVISNYIKDNCRVLGDDYYMDKIYEIRPQMDMIIVRCLFAAGSTPDCMDPHEATISIPVINLVSYVWDVLMRD